MKEAAEKTSLSALGDREGDQVDGQHKETLNTDNVRAQEGEFLLPTQVLQLCCLFCRTKVIYEENADGGPHNNSSVSSCLN